MHHDQIIIGLKNSTFIVAAEDGDTTVGMARLISDGCYVVLIVDVLVLPDYQRKGIGKNMMGQLMEYIHRMLGDGYCIQVDLMAAKGMEAIY
jgi:GNAT superfamily N-acetyltransferase